MSNRKENQLEKTAEKFEKEKDMQTNATLRAEQKMKEQTELVSEKDNQHLDLNTHALAFTHYCGNRLRALPYYSWLISTLLLPGD